jgi:lipoprotein-releasing system ATP-binding protein
LLEIKKLTKSFPTAEGILQVLSGIELSFRPGEAISIMGPSGSGKSTFLYILGALEPPTEGTVQLDGINPYQLSEDDLSRFRNQKVGFIFQDHCLLPQCSVLENVLIPTMVAHNSRNYRERAHELLSQVGLSDRLNHFPAQLSGGERQRVALARALICRPSLLLCDEPTGNLDRRSAETVTTLLLDIHRSESDILIFVTHNAELAARFPIRFEMNYRQLARI